MKDFPDCHRPLSKNLDLAAILCHAEDRVIANDYTFCFAGQRFCIDHTQVQAGMRNQRLRVEVRLDGELKARYQGIYLSIGECGAREPAPVPVARKSSPKDHTPAAEQVDGRILRPAESSAVDTAQRPGVKANSEDALFLSPKPPLGNSPKQMGSTA